MERMRPKINSEAKKAIENSLGDTIRMLVAEIESKGANSILENPREYRIAKTITSEELKMLAVLPFEIYLTEHDAGLTLITGQKGSAIPQFDDGRFKRDDWETQTRTLRQARFTLHNHPDAQYASPSPGDFSVSGRSQSQIDIITARDGLVVHKTDEHASSDSVGNLAHSAAAYFMGGSIKKEYDLKKGNIDAWITWDDERAKLICEYINGDQSWETYADRVKSDPTKRA